MCDNNDEKKDILIQELKNYKNSDKKFPELLKTYVKENVPDTMEAERFLKEFNESYLKEMNLDDLELLCSFILKKRDIKI
ncbi:conserved Plasmodium protein, unknown function [Plasmodium vinckei brucechwatti]|uniref:Uncharacterized protein n=1 Tax=Plasmodium vinckei brucechwatti TaxID=119398 RepID=A0A6V7S662_PLAVN|nr:conserved Plasmodium protein, unknown function [Plasmodium vinckei brucechwatti]